MILSQVIGAAAAVSTAGALAPIWVHKPINDNHSHNLDNPIQILTDRRIYQKIRIRDKE